MAYQMVQAASPAPEPTGVYNGPYMTGEEYQELLDVEKRLDAAWKNVEEGLED